MSKPPDPLPQDAILVHVGPHKTGTSAIQSTLADARAELPAHGVHYPGRRIAHHHEAKALRQISDGWKGDADAIPRPAVWSRFASRVAETPGRVVVSSEFLAQADQSACKQLVSDLGAERVHIVVAARQPGPMAVSMWQQVLRYGYPIDLDQWLDRNFRRSSPAERRSGFWVRADTAGLVRVFAGEVGLNRVSVLVIDEGDRRLLPRTFEQLLELPEGLLADRRPPQTNRGLTAVEAALLRQIIDTLDSQLTWAEYTQMVRQGVTKRVLEERTPGPDEVKAGLPPWAAEQAAAESERIIDDLQASGVRIIGDLDALRRTTGGPDDPPVVDKVPVDLAAQAVVGAIARATRGTTTFDSSAPQRSRVTVREPREDEPPAAKPRSRPVDDVPARELARILGSRVRTGVRRRVGRLRGRS